MNIRALSVSCVVLLLGIVSCSPKVVTSPEVVTPPKVFSPFDKEAMTITNADAIPKEVALKFLKDDFEFVDQIKLGISEKYDKLISQNPVDPFTKAGREKMKFQEREAYGKYYRKPGTTTCYFSKDSTLLSAGEKTRIKMSNTLEGFASDFGESKIVGNVALENNKLSATGVGTAGPGGGESTFGMVAVNASLNRKVNGKVVFGDLQMDARGYVDSFEIGDKMISAGCAIYLSENTSLKKVGAALDALGFQIKGGLALP
ncbi:MAG: hypothetical protein HW380_3000 [Magnetococcales bacterium]|nr:hypothetical protein [Magnetococcales bacterium]HIJ82727.1 hypothetical protein [Magnetococcales bacterium]